MIGDVVSLGAEDWGAIVLALIGVLYCTWYVVTLCRQQRAGANRRLPYVQASQVAQRGGSER